MNHFDLHIMDLLTQLKNTLYHGFNKLENTSNNIDLIIIRS